MFKSKVTEVLKVLSQEQIKEVKLLINSPLYNKNKNLIKLFDALKLFHPDYNDAKCNKEMLYWKVFGRRQYNDKIMRNLLSELYKLLEEYLVYKSSKKYPDYREMLLFEDLMDFDSIFLKKYNEAFDTLKKEKINNDYFRRKATLLRSRIIYFLNKNKQHKITMDALHKAENNIFDLLSALPSNASNITANQSSYNIDYGLNVHDIFFECFDYKSFIKKIENKHPDSELIKLNYHRFMLFYTNHPDDLNHSREVKSYILNNYHNISFELLSNIFIQLTNFYTTKRDDGYDTEIMKDEFEVYKLMADSRIFFSEGQSLRSGTYESIIRAALSMNQIEWTENFVKTHVNCIEPSEREYLVNHGRAQLAFKKKNFHEVISICSRISQETHYHKFFVKWILFRVYYELGYDEQFYYHSETFRKYVENTNFITPERKKKYKAIIKFGNRLMNIKNKYDRSELLYLKNEIEFFYKKNIIGKQWLLEKVEELMK